MEMTHVAKPINNTSSFLSAVDIIIPYFGQYEKVTALLQSIFKFTRSNYYHVYAIDDGSPNALFGKTMQENANNNAKKAKTDSCLTVIRNPKQYGFGHSCEIGYLASNNPYVCFIQSDCLIENSGWLRSLGECLLKLKEKNVRMVSPVTNNSMGGSEHQQSKPEINNDIVLEDGFLSLFCFLCHRDLFSKIGGFIKNYPYAGYEDQELAYRMSKYNFKQAVCRSCFVYHEGGCTIKQVTRNNPEIVKIVEEENRQKCIEDMKNILNK